MSPKKMTFIKVSIERRAVEFADIWKARVYGAYIQVMIISKVIKISQNPLNLSWGYIMNFSGFIKLKHLLSIEALTRALSADFASIFLSAASLPSAIRSASALSLASFSALACFNALIRRYIGVSSGTTVWGSPPSSPSYFSYSLNSAGKLSWKSSLKSSSPSRLFENLFFVKGAPVLAFSKWLVNPVPLISLTFDGSSPP
jgi:hypothetical protein